MQRRHSHRVPRGHHQELSDDEPVCEQIQRPLRSSGAWKKDAWNVFLDSWKSDVLSIFRLSKL